MDKTLRLLSFGQKKDPNPNDANKKEIPGPANTQPNMSAGDDKPSRESIWDKVDSDRYFYILWHS